MAVAYQKAKNVSKLIVTKGPALNKLILDTMETISSIVGATLGPGGMPVLLERFEHDMPPTITKDGVTVMRSLGMDNSAAQCIMESTSSAAVRTVTEAGDGTTTAIVLADAFVRYISRYCVANPKESAQKVVRRLEHLFRTVMEPLIKATAIKVDSTTPEGQLALRSVARVSANGDDDLAGAVMDCFGLVGDEGNVTISEVSGESGYQVTPIDGFPVMIGYEDSCANFYPKFVNDLTTQKVMMDKPVFLLYYGNIADIQTIVSMLQKLGNEFERFKNAEAGHDDAKFNLVVCATGFSNSTLGMLARNFGNPDSVKIYPLVAPRSPFLNGQLEFLRDLAAITGAKLFDPLNNPIEKGDLPDLGPGVERFEASRFRSTVVGNAGEDAIIERAAEIEGLLLSPESELDKIYLQQRLGKLTGGIADLKVIGASNGELKEKRDRAEDAVCSVRGAIRYGYLPGGAWMLLRICYELLRMEDDPVVTQIVIPALVTPFYRLLSNCGLNEETIKAIEVCIEDSLHNGNVMVYDALEHRFGTPLETGVLDATPAVLEALRNALSIASQLGTCGGIVAYKRDHELELSEAAAASEWNRAVEEGNVANEKM